MAVLCFMYVFITMIIVGIKIWRNKNEYQVPKIWIYKIQIRHVYDFIDMGL